MTQPNLRVFSDASTATATASSWLGSSVVINGIFQSKGSATDLELFVSVSATSVAASSVMTPVLVGSAATSFATSATITPDKGSLTTVGANSATAHAHYAQLSYPYYRVQYTPTGSVSLNAISVFVFSNPQDSIDNTDQ